MTNIYKDHNGKDPVSVVEVGSGDGVQLKAFQCLGFGEVLGVEPSGGLVRQSENIGISAVEGLFSTSMVDRLGSGKFDVCISSYTFDHVPDPIDFLKASYNILSEGGILAFEVHNMRDIYERSEWCLFEHEHTIYMDKGIAENLVRKLGFEVVSIDPIDKDMVRANSLIVVAKKVLGGQNINHVDTFYDVDLYRDSTHRIQKVIRSIDQWISNIPNGDNLVGWGVGGRGVMTLAAIKRSGRFQTIFDSNYDSGQLLTPKTRVPISGRDALPHYRGSWVLIFSFGYAEEITQDLLTHGFDKNKIFALNDFYSS